MRNSRPVFALVAVLLSFFLTVTALSAPTDPDNFTTQAGGFVDLPLGSFVEGSTRFGGMQPDYRIEYDPSLKNFIKQVQKATGTSPKVSWWNLFAKLNRKPEASYQSKIELVTAMIQTALPDRLYRSEPYLEVLETHKIRKMDVTLGSYLQCKAGVCRENALLTHLALKAVGIPNYYVYVQAQSETRTEDHAIVVVEIDNQKWIVDPYNEGFHGKNLEDVMRPDAIENPAERVAGFSKELIPAPLRIIRINPYPVYWLPKPFCSKMF